MNKVSELKLMDLKAVKEALRVSQSKVYQLVGSGRLPHYRIGGAIRVSEDQLLAYLESCESKDTTPRTKLRRQLKHVRL